MPGVFLSYRREDSSGYAGRLFDILSAQFGKENVYMDFDTIKFAGDLNQELSNGAEKNPDDNQLLRQALYGSDLICLTAEITYSFEGVRKLSIDHICVSRSLTSSAPAFSIPDESRKCSFRIPKDSVAKQETRYWYTPDNERLSDHYGVIATVSSATGRPAK